MSFDLTDEELATRFDQIPVLAGRPRTVEELSGGLTNRNLKVTTPDGAFVARCSDPNVDVLGIDRDAEHHNSRAAEEAGVGAPVCDYRPDLGILVIGFLEGRTLTSADVRDEAIVPRLAEACRTLHGGPRFQGDFDISAVHDRYLAAVRRADYRVPDGWFDLADDAARIREALQVHPAETVPCHNDLLAENLVDDGERLWLIDYEYAGNNDPCFELGNIWAECDLGDDALEALVSAYFDGHRPDKLARARLLGVLGQYTWTLWGAIQHAVSPLDYDFWTWATEHLERAEQELRGPHLDRLLEAVREGDA